MRLPALSPEAELVLLTAGGAHADARIRELAAGPVDWEAVTGLATWEHAEAPVWQRLSSLLDAAALEPLAPLRRLAMVADFQQSHLAHRLQQSLGVLGAHGIEPVLLKGAALAQTVYRSFGERPMADIDLLVEPDRAVEARALLLGAGWVDEDERPHPPPESYQRHHHLPPLVDASRTGVAMELHTALFFEGHPFRLTTEEVWRGSRVVTGRDGVPRRIPDPHHLLLHACLHFAWSHTMRRGAWRTARDLRALAGTGEVDWNRFVRLARESRGASSCYWTLRLLAPFAGPAVPDQVMRALRPDVGAATHARLERHLRLHLVPTRSRCPSVRLEQLFWEMAIRPGASGHGDVRPWDHSHDFALAPAAPAPSMLRRVARQVRGVGRWTRYVRALL